MTVSNEELRAVLINALKRAYFNGHTDNDARKNGVIPNDTKLGEYQIEKLAKEVEDAITSHEQAICDRLIGEAKTCYDCVHEEDEYETPVKFVPVSIIEKMKEGK